MAGSSRYTAVLDANVLYGRLLRDVLLSLADAHLYSAKWSADIREEWMRNLIANKPEKEASVRSASAAMERAIPDCLVTGYEHLIESLKLPDPSDRHVLAAAITGHADCIVTLNEKDFPTDVLLSFGIERQTPDEFVLNQIMLQPPIALAAIKRMRERWQKPEYTAPAMIDVFELRGLAQTAAHLRDVVDLI